MNIDGTLGNKYQGATRTRPYDFGTDAIERQRVSLGQSLIDADFEYGLQSTKWQTHMDTRKFLSFTEIPGSDLPFNQVQSDSSGRVLTITLPAGLHSNLVPQNGQLISVQGLSNIGSNAQGIFQVLTNTSNTSVSMFTQGIMPPSTTFTLRSATSIRRATYINSSNGAANSGFSLNVASISINTASTSNTMNISFGTAYHGILPGMILNISNVYAFNPGFTAFGYSNPALLRNGNCAGYFTVNSVPNFSNITSDITSSVNTSTVGITGGQFRQFAIGSSNAGVYVNSQGYALHRPYDGGVLITVNNPSFGATFVRQSKKVFRYQSGKGLLWSSGTLFCPNNDISTISANGTIPSTSNNITVQCAVPVGCPQVGAFVQLRGITSPGYNGNYEIKNIIDNFTFNVAVTNRLTTLAPTLGDQPRFIITRWQGSCVRVGCFDEQNGLFWEFDGQTLWAVRRTSTLQISGLVTATPGQNSLVGVNTRFQDQFKINDKFTLKGMTYIVVATPTQSLMFFNPPYRGTTIATDSTVCQVKDFIVPQNQFNRDTIDGSGPSGFKFDATKMQMVGIQYTWYGAGFVDFMIRGSDGNWVYAHRMRQNNINDEAYMRTGNLPVRYELTNETSHATTKLLQPIGEQDSNLIYTTEQLNYWPPSGVVMVDNELIAYTSKTSNTLILGSPVCRANTLTYMINNVSTPLSAGPAVAHLTGNTAFLFSTTCSPSLTHWGSALLMDGEFDQDRGYLFNYQLNAFGISIPANANRNLFMIRLAPSASNGIVGDLGQRELLNKAQLLLSRLDVWAQTATIGQGNVIISGILNPQFTSQQSFNTMNWTSVNSPIGLSAQQPSFAQVTNDVTNLIYLTGSGERVFSTIINAGSQYSIDLNELKEISCNANGGNNAFPDGPDTLLIQISCPPGAQTITQYSLNLFWSEAQA